jgi:transposase, IS5 family
MQSSFFEVQDCYERLDKGGDPLVKLDKMIDWSSVLPLLDEIKFSSTSKGGRPGLDPLVVVKCLLLQSLYNLSDDACEYQVNDRLSFKRFLGLRTSEKAPDSKSLWLYRDRMKDSGLHDKIFAWFLGQIESAGYCARNGQIVDATFIPAHKPTRKHEKQLADGVQLSQAQRSQIDEEATFTKKGEKTYHGYKNHIQVDRAHKFIRRYSVTTASVHDSQELVLLIDRDASAGEEVWADSAYSSAATEQLLVGRRLTSRVHERAYSNKPLTEEQKAMNKARSKVRARVEHVFGHMVNSMGGLIVHVIGLARVEVKVTMKNLAYNLQRFAMLEARKT